MLIELRVEDYDPYRAADIANTLVTVLIDRNDSLLTNRYASSEVSLQAQLTQMESQISDLQNDIALASQETLKTEQAVLETRIGQIEEEILNLQKEINLIQPPGDPSAAANLSPESAAEVSRKKLRVEQLGTSLSFYQRTLLNLMDSGTPSGNAYTSSELEQMRSTLTLYQNIYTNLLNNFENTRLARLKSSPNVVQVEVASPPMLPVRPKPYLNAFLGGIAGLILSLSAIFIHENLDDTLKTPDDIEEALNVPVIGYIPEMAILKAKNYFLIAAEEPRSPISESFRSLRTNLDFAGIDKPLRTVLVSSAGPSEGKSCVAANLAVTIAQTGKKVCLIDGDLRKPSLHKYLTVSNRIGFSDIFLNHRTLQAICKPWKDTNLSYISSGNLPPNPAELLGSEKMKIILQQLTELFEFIIFDSPPFMVADSSVIASQVDGVIIVIHPGRTNEGAARLMMTQLNRVNARVLGVVMNRLNLKHSSYYGAYRQYSNYGHTGATGYGEIVPDDKSKRPFPANLFPPRGRTYHRK
jgi:capsular exopolysaccharide synthesis family protein